MELVSVRFERILEQSILFGRGTDAPSMFLGHRPSYLRIGLQPEYNHRLNDPFRVGKMLRTVIFKRFEDLRIEAVRALDCLGLLRWLGFGISSWHDFDCTIPEI